MDGWQHCNCPRGINVFQIIFLKQNFVLFPIFATTNSYACRVLSILIKYGHISGVDPGFFLGGGARLLLYFNTNKPHSFFFCRIPVVLENCRSSQGGGGCAPPAPSPQIRPCICAVICVKTIWDGTGLNNWAACGTQLWNIMGFLHCNKTKWQTTHPEDVACPTPSSIRLIFVGKIQVISGCEI